MVLDASAPLVPSSSTPTADVHPVQLAWKNICYTVQEKKHKQGMVDKRILQDIGGHACAGSFTAILGASGSGKTSLLSVLAHRLLATKNARLTGDMTINGDALPSDYRTRCAFVQQQEVFYPQGTVRETVTLAARMRLGRSMSTEAKQQRALDVIQQLSLTKTLDTKVGDGARIKGISGGEMKRVGIACELVSSPSLLMLDEPTSGLDSSAALNVVKGLKSLARTGRTIIASIHQPGSAIYELFDTIVVLAEGKLSYFGPANETVEHFTKIGFPCPPLFNPADHMLQITSIDYSSSESEAETRGILEKIHGHGAKMIGDPPAPNAVGAGPAVENSTSFCEQFGLLYKRIFNDAIRNTVALAIKLVQGVFTTLIIVALYMNVDGGDVVNISLQNTSALLFFITTTGLFGPLFGTIQAFAPEVSVVFRERTNNLYSVGPYYVAKLLVSIPIELFPLVLQNTIAYWLLKLNHSADRYGMFLLFTCAMTFASIGIGFSLAVAAGGNVQAASAGVGPVALIFMLLAGFFINSSTIPAWINWLSRLDYMNWVFQGLCINEFNNYAVQANGYTAPGGRCPGPGEQGFDPTKCIEGTLVLDQFFNNGNSRTPDEWNAVMWRFFFFIVAFIVLFNFLAYLILLAKGPKYLSMTRE